MGGASPRAAPAFLLVQWGHSNGKGRVSQHFNVFEKIVLLFRAYSVFLFFLAMIMS
jgi:hypothetical protein